MLYIQNNNFSTNKSLSNSFDLNNNHFIYIDSITKKLNKTTFFRKLITFYGFSILYLYIKKII